MRKHPWVNTERKFYERNFKKLIEKLDLTSDLNILDYGCGTGGFASLLAEHNSSLKIKAVDSNPEAIKLGKKYYSHLPNLNFEVLNYIPEGNYDLIFYNLVLHELNNSGDVKTINNFLQKAYNFLKQGGKISIFDNRKIPKKDFEKLYIRNKSPNKKNLMEEYLEHNKYTLKDWKDMVEKSGFITEYCEELAPNLFKRVARSS